MRVSRIAAVFLLLGGILGCVDELIASPRTKYVGDHDQIEGVQDTLAMPAWDLDLVTRFSGAQTGFHNWAEGGINSLSLTAGTNGRALLDAESWRQLYELRLAFGVIRQSGTEVRKAEDVIRLHTSFSYQGDGFYRTFSPTLALSMRTQFAPGFNYDRNPLDDGRTPPVKVSDFFAPATLQQSIGLSYQYEKWFAHRLGVGAKQTIVAIPRVRSIYGIDSNRWARSQVGLESRTDVDRDIAKNVHLKSTLGLFAAFNQPDLPDMTWENLINMKVNSWLSVNFEFVTFFDRDVSSQLQMREVLSVGLTMVIL
ncbi:MAG: DUF3078 domain-containing protein [Rhodothermales bacterium]